MGMNIDDLRKKVYEANMELVERGLVIYTWGNVSAIDREAGVVAIKPRGIEYADLEWQDISVTDLDGNAVDDNPLLPSVDLDYHLAVYKGFKDVGGMAHTHSVYATVFAQALKDIPCLGTTHADHFHGDIPCLPYLPEKAVKENYEFNAGQQIVEYFTERGIDPNAMRAVLCGGHGPFTWGKDAAEAVHNAAVLEEAAFMNFHSLQLDPKQTRMQQELLDKHYLRKRGKNAYYGQTAK